MELLRPQKLLHLLDFGLVVLLRLERTGDYLIIQLTQGDVEV